MRTWVQKQAGTRSQVDADALVEFADIAALAAPLESSVQHQHPEPPRQPPPRPPPLPVPPPRRDGPQDALHDACSCLPADSLWAVEVSTYTVPPDILPESHALVVGAWCVALKPRGPPFETPAGQMLQPVYPLPKRLLNTQLKH